MFALSDSSSWDVNKDLHKSLFTKVKMKKIAKIILKSMSFPLSTKPSQSPQQYNHLR